MTELFTMKDIILQVTGIYRRQRIRETHGVHISIKLAVNPITRTGFYAEMNRIEDGKWLGMTTMGENPNVGYDTPEEAAEKGIGFFLQDIIRRL